jgi:uncharacterized membrane protein YcgQ (UPF0703/DUF1980 family)
MKKAASALAVFVLFIAGCSNAKSKATPAEALFVPAGVDFVIREKMFIAQVNEVYLNRNDYFGKTIMLEGIFRKEEYGGRNYCYVIRNGPGCCGEGGLVGFEVSWDLPGLLPADAVEYPKGNAWVEVLGKLEKYEINGQYVLYLALSELNTLEKRGAEFVSQ